MSYRTSASCSPVTRVAPINDGFLSTIETFEDDAPSANRSEDEPQFRFKPVRRANRRLAYRSQNIEEERQRHRRETLIKESLCWLALLLWLATIFWFRAVSDPAIEGNTARRNPRHRPRRSIPDCVNRRTAPTPHQQANREMETPAPIRPNKVASAAPSPAPTPNRACTRRHTGTCARVP